MNKMTRQERIKECNMLQGDINRIMVTRDFEELKEMYAVACVRLARLYEGNYSRILEYYDEEEI